VAANRREFERARADVAAAEAALARTQQVAAQAAAWRGGRSSATTAVAGDYSTPRDRRPSASPRYIPPPRRNWCHAQNSGLTEIYLRSAMPVRELGCPAPKAFLGRQI
jgi:hypothetical protein